LPNEGYFKGPVKLLVFGDGYALINVYNDDASASTQLCNMLKPSNVINTRMVAERR
jgi:hypothetical protein